MKKHNWIFTIASALALITIACNALSTVPATPQGWQPGHPPQPPIPGQSHPATQPSGQQPEVQGPVPSQQPLLDQTATIPAGGGSAEVGFQASSGQRIQILLSAANPSVQPYGSLQSPDGTSVYNPPINTAANGVNQVEIAIDQTGQYTLTLFDGSNQGGEVSVKIIALK